MKFSRKQFISALVGIPILGACYMKLAEPNWYEVTTKTIHIDRFENPLRILHL